jgi:hypothetical protein
LKKLFPGEKIEKNYKNTLQSLRDALEAEVKTMKGELHNARWNELQDAKAKVEKVTDGCDFMDLLASQQEKVNKLTMELAFHKSSEDSFKHYITDSSKNLVVLCVIEIWMQIKAKI